LRYETRQKKNERWELAFTFRVGNFGEVFANTTVPLGRVMRYGALQCI